MRGLERQMRGLERVINLDSGETVKLTQAKRRVADCICAWVEFGVSIRTLTLVEQIAARNEQARLREPLALAELPGLTFEPPPSAVDAHLRSLRLALDATAICCGYYHPVGA
jgi:hypothetical protein